MHQFTNMVDYEDTEGRRSGFQDIEIPLKKCEGKEVDWRGNPNYYCPRFDQNHFIHGGFSADKFSWMRLALHICDSRPEARLQRIANGKTHEDCEDEETSRNYFLKTVVGVEAISKEASIDDEFSKNIYKAKSRQTVTQDDLIVSSRRDI